MAPLSRTSFLRPWIVLSVLWIAAVGVYRAGDIAAALAGEPIEIRYKSPPQVRFGLGPAPPGKSLDQLAQVELPNPTDHRFEFPAGTPAGAMAKAIDDWAALGNAVEAKLHAGSHLADYSDDELARLAEMRGLKLDPSSGIRGALDWNAELARPLTIGEATPFALSGAELAAQAVSQRPAPGAVATDIAAWALSMPLALLGLGLLGGRVERR